MRTTGQNRALTLVLAIMTVAVVSAAPAHADIASVIDGIRTTYLTNALFKAIGTIMIVAFALMGMMGRMEWMKVAMLVVCGALISNAPQIAGTIFGG